jgi:hypothetical protein
MSHILEEYAKNLGVYISKPIVSEHYFPICEDKYIVLHSEEKIQSKNYKYYNMVLELLRPFLIENNIKIIQIDCKSEPVSHVNKVLSNLSFKQYAYIISKALLYIGVDNVYSHYASSKNIPIINLFGNVYPSISNGYWSKNNEKIDIPAKWSNKPCLSLVDPKAEINTIKPEEIAQGVLTLLKQKKTINFKTLYIGSMFNERIIEVIPDKSFNNTLDKNKTIFIRADYGFNEKIFLDYCLNYRVAIITDKLIQHKGLLTIKNNIQKLSLIVERDSETIPSEYFDLLKKYKIEFQILVKNEDDLGFIKNKYFDYSVNLYTINKNKPENIHQDCKFFSNKILIEGEKVYPSKAHWISKEKMIDKIDYILDTNEYWNELDHFYIYEQSQTKASSRT